MTGSEIYLLYKIGGSLLSQLAISTAKRKKAKRKTNELIKAYKNFDNLTDAELDALSLRGKKSSD